MHRLEHLRTDTQDNVTFKHLSTNQFIEALQFGIQHIVECFEVGPAHGVLFRDFCTIEVIHFPKSGATTPNLTPPHDFNDFTIRSFAPVVFRHFREKFNIKPEDYLYSINKPFRELKISTASGSLFYSTADDKFVIKTIQEKEAQLLKTLLSGYYMNIMQNKQTLLPKLFALYGYQSENKDTYIIVMNNLIPSHIRIHEKYDLKGSTFKRRANSKEQQKESPTWQDLDFIERHPEGLILDVDTYNALARTVKRDCLILESFHIINYSFFIGVHQVDAVPESLEDFTATSDPFSLQPKLMMCSTPIDNIQVKFDQHNKPDDYLANIQARTASGQKLLLNIGIIDILQSYQLREKIYHIVTSMVTDASQLSITNPSLYSDRFQRFLFSTVFKTAPLKQGCQIEDL